ncbi:protein TolR [Actinobacillus delphinicola]|uniref:Tol-Pal system protein TolR n=1 Tax=Actinobacillus delphinicola TaxID=51161 RepID=A0A448TV14_9PAST|nr:colicin uptake protein TolR [Actinobacillus delphinicola]MDG6897911.1 protein TolR [Actinobacillus delphinicola]VEJ09777.1 colicin uptake protein TolR [Actinobacillus delphinicola]
MTYRRRKSRRNIKAEINIVPFLDVLLVLLLIFMATAPVISQSVKVDLPDATVSENVNSSSATPVILEVPGDGFYRLSIGNKHYDNLSDVQVVLLAKTEYQRDPKSLFLVGGAKQIPYEQVMNALNLLHEAGIQSVGLMTNPVSKKG